MASGGSSEVVAYNESGKRIQLVYDTWTPRPHFIAVQCTPKSDANATELQETYEIIGRFLLANQQFDREVILSFHRGKWYQQHTGKWHAHLCVPYEPYVEQARTQITTISNNKEWKGARNVAEGMNAWQRRKMEEYARYKQECVQNGIPGQTQVENVGLSTFSSNEFELAWTFSTPRISIIAQSANSTLDSLYTFMSNVRVNAEQALRQKDSRFANFGCHLCLYVRGQDGSAVTPRRGQIFTANGNTVENTNIVGYIQMDETQYIQWLPSNLRNAWFTAFRAAEHFVRT